jgi:hypothetical protein
MARGPEVSKVCSITQLCGLRVTVESYPAPKGTLQCKLCKRLDTRSATADTRPDASRVGAPTSPIMSCPRGQPLCCSCGGNSTANYRASLKWKEVKAAIAKRVPVLGSKNTATSNTAALNAMQAGPSAVQLDLGEGWSHVVQGVRVVKANIPPTIPNPHQSRRLPSNRHDGHQKDGEA